MLSLQRELRRLDGSIAAAKAALPRGQRALATAARGQVAARLLAGEAVDDVLAGARMDGNAAEEIAVLAAKRDAVIGEFLQRAISAAIAA